MYDYKQWLEESPVNHYGDKVTANVIIHPADGKVYFRCQDKHWQTAHKAWCKAYRNDENVPQPYSEGHCMFLDPLGYGCVPLGETRPGMIRRAIRSTVIAHLHGWDREMRKSIAGMKQLAKIVRATVNAKANGQDTGAGEYLACIMVGIDL